MRERGSYVGHTFSEFMKVLRIHARDYLAGPSRPFKLEELYSKTPLGKRNPEAVRRDYFDIVDGLFLQPSEEYEDSYGFRSE